MTDCPCRSCTVEDLPMSPTDAEVLAYVACGHSIGSHVILPAPGPCSGCLAEQAVAIAREAAEVAVAASRGAS